MQTGAKIWLLLLDSIQAILAELPARWPAELPPESDARFWWEAVRHEMAGRKALSEKLARIADTGECPELTDFECWMARRRGDWAAQVVAAQLHTQPPDDIRLLLRWALIETWEKDGCVGFWNHAERGGEPHPKWIDGLFQP